MIKFKEITIQNFLSIGNQPIKINLDESPTTLITGNSGSGKSSLCDAFCFALYNKPYRNINKPLLVNTINHRNLLVILTFETRGNEYKIKRGIKPNIFEIYENDKLISQEANNLDYQNLLETVILGMSEKSFRQVCLIGASNYIPFMNLPTSSRREIIEDLLDIKIFSKMLEIAKVDFSSLKEQLNSLDTSVNLLEEKLKFYKEESEKSKINSKDKKEQLEKDIKTLENKIKETLDKQESIQKDIKIYQDKIEKKDIYKEQYEKLIGFNKTYQYKDKDNKQLQKFFKDNSVCSTCKQEITNKHKKEILETLNKEAEEYNILLEKADKKLKNIKDILEKIQNITKDINKLKQDYSSNCASETAYKHQLNNLKNELLNLKDSSIEIQETIFKLNEDYSKVLNDKKEVLTEKEYLDYIINLLKDTGIRSKIIKRYLPIINKKMNELLVNFGLPVSFTLDENFNEVIKSRFRDTFCYNSFSEGEKRRIDLSLLLCWREVAKQKNTLSTNLLIFDEMSETNLDEQSIEEWSNIIDNLSKELNIIIITHKPDSYIEKFERHLVVEKVGNFTKIKEV